MEVKPIVWMNENRGEIGAMVAIIPTTSSFHVVGESSSCGGWCGRVRCCTVWLLLLLPSRGMVNCLSAIVLLVTYHLRFEKSLVFYRKEDACPNPESKKSKKRKFKKERYQSMKINKDNDCIKYDLTSDVSLLLRMF